jgi:hypothetical protein
MPVAVARACFECTVGTIKTRIALACSSGEITLPIFGAFVGATLP